MFFDLKIELKKIILNTSNISYTYTHKYSHSKYSLDLIIDEIFVFLKMGVSWVMFRSSINSKTLFWHVSRFVKNNIFLRLFNIIKNKYIKKYMTNDSTLFIDSTIINNKYG